MPQLSIIVPVYNVEPYLRRCIDSILAQTFTDFELILIDDGSPDRCGEIMEEYAAKDKRIVTIHQENKGVSAARNAGLRIAQGTYVGFVDPDDWIDAEMYKNMISRMQETDAELSISSWNDVLENGDRSEHMIDLPDIIDGHTAIIHLFDLPRTTGLYLWNRVYVRSYIKVLFDEQAVCSEDALFLFQYCGGINRACFVSAALYNFFHRDSSASRGKNKSTLLGLNAKRKIITAATRLDNTIWDKAEMEYLDFLMGSLITAKKTNPDDYRRSKSEIRYYIAKYFSHFVSNNQITKKGKIYICLRATVG